MFLYWLFVIVFQIGFYYAMLILGPCSPSSLIYTTAGVVAIIQRKVEDRCQQPDILFLLWLLIIYAK